MGRSKSPSSTFPSTQTRATTRTHQSDSEEAAIDSSALLRGQNRVLELIARGASLHETLDTLLRIVEEQSPGMLASILLLAPDGLHVRHGAAPSLPQRYIKAIDGEPIGPAAGSCGTAAFRREPVIVEDIATDPLWVTYRSFALEHGLRACWSTPIFDEHHRVLGTFALYFQHAGRPSEKHLKQIEMGTYTASIAIVRSREREALATAEQRLRLALEAGNIGIWERDIKTDRLIWSSQLKTLFGYSSEGENVDFDTFLQLVHPDDRDQVLLSAQQTISQRQSTAIEFRTIWPDGSTHWILSRGRTEYDQNGEPACVRGIGFDVTERKQMEEELRLRESQLADAQRIAHFGSYEWVSGTNTVHWTEELFRIFGLRPGEIRPTLESYLERVHPDDRERTRKIIEECLHNGTPFETEERISRPDGSTRLLLSQGRWLHDENRRTKKLVGTCHDITARRENERARVRLEEEVQQIHKMEAVGRLAGGVAHDFNNLLTVIFGHVGLCEQGLPATSRVRSSLKEIQHAAERAATLTRHLLAFSRRQVIYPILLDLNDVVRKLQDMLTRVIGEHISLCVTTNEYLGSIRADLGQIDQIVMNLVLNAVDAMPQGGQIFIETSNVELDEHYAKSHPSVQPGRYVMIAVTDTGLGIEEDVLAHIFEPFFTTKPMGEGTGLGLSVVQGAVQQNNGHITVYSQLGKGTTFKAYFPRVDEAATPISPVNEQQLPKGSGTILLVEDDSAVRKLTTDLLVDHGYRVLAAENAANAIEISESFTNDIELLVTDVVMPDMGGPDLAKKLQSQRPGLNVLYVSGYTGTLLSHQGLLTADAKLLSKPFTKRELLEHVKAAIRDSV